MPGVDFGRVRALVTMVQVLSLIGFEPSSRSGSEWYGSCPLHECGPSRRHSSFSVNVATVRYCCHRYGSQGNQLEPWAALTDLPLHQAAVDLCRRLSHDVPWPRRW